jgi:hypothetical protein
MRIRQIIVRLASNIYLLSPVLLVSFVLPMVVHAEEQDLSQLECPARFQDGLGENYGHSHEVLVVAEPTPTAIVT